MLSSGHFSKAKYRFNEDIFNHFGESDNSTFNGKVHLAAR
jgi:hypothetical protein